MACNPVRSLTGLHMACNSHEILGHKILGHIAHPFQKPNPRTHSPVWGGIPCRVPIAPHGFCFCMASPCAHTLVAPTFGGPVVKWYPVQTTNSFAHPFQKPNSRTYGGLLLINENFISSCNKQFEEVQMAWHQ